MEKEKPDPQVSARLLRNAQAIKGGREPLADALGVHPHDLAQWVAGKSFPPQDVLERVLEIILEAHERKYAPNHRVLLADTAAGCEVLARILGEGLDFVCVHTTADAQAVLRRGGIDAIVCGQHFDGSQMLRFLQLVKADERSRGIPFIGCRALSSQLGEVALSALREACEALGAVAYIDLPERERKEGVEAAAVEFRDAVRAAARFPREASQLRILVADDNADAAHTLSALLQMAGHQVLKARDGVEAVKIALRERPDAAILDIGMPKLSGYDVAERLRMEAWGQEMILIALTGYGAPADVERARGSGFDHHFLKPVTFDQLMRVLPKRSRSG